MLGNQLNKIVLTNIATVKIFNKFGVDYTANRDKTLEEIADYSELDLYKIVEELSNADDFRKLRKKDFRFWTQNLIIDDLLLQQHKMIEELRVYFLKKSNSIYLEFSKECPQLFELRDLIRNMLEDMASHIKREENTLFPAIKHIEFKGSDDSFSESALYSSVITLIQNHEHATQDLRLIEKRVNEILTISFINKEVEEFCNEVSGLCEALFQHIFIEDEILFKIVVET